jgi:hypothetical protein
MSEYLAHSLNRSRDKLATRNDHRLHELRLGERQTPNFQTYERSRLGQKFRGAPQLQPSSGHQGPRVWLHNISGFDLEVEVMIVPYVTSFFLMGEFVERDRTGRVAYAE